MLQMIKKNLKTLIITTIITLLPIVAGLILWDKLPEQMPTHFNIHGEADGFSSKTFGVFGLPVLLAVLHWICTVGTKADPKQKNHSEKMQTLVLWICPLISLIVSTAIYAYSMEINIDVLLITNLICGVAFIIAGNYLPKCKQNYTIGIKLPWTLNDEENWNYTHRISGKIWVAGGLIVLLTAILKQMWITVVVLSVIAIVPSVLSYMFHRKKNKKS